ncbi:MAG: ABC transporter permease [Cellulomonas sp. 73-92]|uniref:ABC transporter permease n=1 Tax=Cellulomonas sp. 73-92 TaxID=1895740 RepID=UPI0009282289|nr:ABC transporter permease [Cellulomonas sp. 73-92]OJV83477.1 MAG: ABC transporter permease [Cellulomonas sp. 73-92]
MFLAVRELVFARGRFALMGSVVVLIAMLMVLLSGLSVGLANDGVSGLQRLPVTSLAFQQHVAKDSAFSRSVVPTDAVATWAHQDGVAAAAPFGNTLVNARTNRGLEIDLALFGVEAGSFVDPEVASGTRLTGGPGEVVVSATAAKDGIHLGDVVTVEPLGTSLRVVGILPTQQTFGHVEVGYVPLRTWQEIHAGVHPGDRAPQHVYQEVTAVAVAARPGAGPDLPAADRAAGTTSLTKAQSYGASPGYTAETSTLMMIEAFLYVISALVVGAFFTVLTIQRKREIAVMRAMGAGTRYLLRDSLLQSAVLLTTATALSIGLGLAAGAGISTTAMPFALEAGPVAGAALLTVVLGMVGAAVAVVRIARVDPLNALGGNR